MSTHNMCQMQNLQKLSFHFRKFSTLSVLKQREWLSSTGDRQQKQRGGYIDQQA